MKKLLFTLAVIGAARHCFSQSIVGTWDIKDLKCTVTYKGTQKSEEMPEVQEMFQMVHSRMIISADHSIIHQIGAKGGALQTIDKGTYEVGGNQLSVNWDAAKKIRESDDKSLQAALQRQPKSVKLEISGAEMTWTVEADGLDENGKQGHVVARWIFKRV